MYNLLARDTNASHIRWDNLLKLNAAMRGWLTVYNSGMEAQGGEGQPVSPLIVA